MGKAIAKLGISIGATLLANWVLMLYVGALHSNVKQVPAIGFLDLLGITVAGWAIFFIFRAAEEWMNEVDR